jgi:ankyrin repeat protein
MNTINLKELCNLNYFNPIGLKIAKFFMDIEILLKDAIELDNYDVCKTLLEYKKELKYPLIFSLAIEKNNKKIINLILDYINDISILNELDQYNETPLNKACRNGNLELCKFLLFYNVNINGYYTINENLDKKINDTPLYCAVKSNNSKLVKFLLINGADPNIWSATGYGLVGSLPLHAAIENNNYKIIKLLLMYNADPKEEYTTVCKYGSVVHNSPFSLIINQKKKKILKIFKNYSNYIITNNEYLHYKNNLN